MTETNTTKCPKTYSHYTYEESPQIGRADPFSTLYWIIHVKCFPDRHELVLYTFYIYIHMYISYIKCKLSFVRLCMKYFNIYSPPEMYPFAKL